MFKGNKEQIAKKLKGVRFKNKKAEYIINARKTFSENGGLAVKSKLSHFSTPYEMRDYLVQNVKGMGYKETSHFLRNIGFREKLAILDRHILKNLKLLGTIKEIPFSLPKRDT
ncbi:MAG: hypothetical protein K6U80_18390 [Firmicutes bacterium]|nr:hypothetical protein [Bacillota bacterium]